MAEYDIEVGGDFGRVAAEVASAWQAAQAVDVVTSTDRVVLRDWATRCAVLTPKRLDLLRHVRRSPVSGIRPLARALRRDVRRVHEDVVALAELGFLDRAGNGAISTSLDEIASVVRIAA